MFCKYCKKEIKEDSIICPYCGNNIEDDGKKVKENYKEKLNISTKNTIFDDKELQKHNNRVAELLSEGSIPKVVIIDELVNKKWPRKGAEEFVDKVEFELLNSDKYKYSQKRQNAKIASKYKKTMIGGAIATAVGGFITFISIYAASNLGGTYFCCWGAILFGIISFFIGLVGWLMHRK